MDLLIKHEAFAGRGLAVRDRKSTRLNSSHSQISYAVFCLKKKKTDLLDHSNYHNAIFPVPESGDFLQRTVTNDVEQPATSPGSYTNLLTPHATHTTYLVSH